MRKRSNSSPSLLFQFLAIFLFMALLTFLPDPNNSSGHHHHPHDSKKHHPSNPKPKPKSKSKSISKHTVTSKCKKKEEKEITKQPSSWDQIKNLLTCKQIEESKIHDPSKKLPSSAVYTSCGNICTFRDVVHGNRRVVHRADNSPEGSVLGQETRLLNKKGSHGSSRSVSSMSVRSCAGGVPYTARGMPLRKLSGCYECHTIVDPSRYPLPRTSICACSECGEVFPKIESLEHHQAVRHAVSELGPEDSSRNIVEIIFKSSWLKKDNPICKIERILKVHNTKRTIQRFEDYRDAVKIRANTNAKKNARCAADGNELLRFHCAKLTCTLGANGSSSLCCSIPACGVCTIIRHGFQGNKVNGIRTTASSGRAHDCLGTSDTRRRAMLVCRVIAGRVKNMADDVANEENDVAHNRSFDSVAGYAGIYSNLEELNVFSSRAILPCFVVIYNALES